MLSEKKIKNPDSDEDMAKLRNAVLKWINIKENKKNAAKNDFTSKKILNFKKKDEAGVRNEFKKKNRKNKHSCLSDKSEVTKILILILIIVAFVFSSFTLCLYYFCWQNEITKKITKIIPYPVAVVNFKPISYNLWQGETEALIHLYKQQTTENILLKIPELQETKKHVLERLITQELLNQLAKSYGIETNRQEIKDYTQKLSEEIGGIEHLENQLNYLYNWTIEEFEEKIVKSIIIKGKVEIALNFDERLNQDSLRKIKFIEEELNNNHQSFEYLAEKYSEDVTAIRGGDLGYFSQGQMFPEFEKAVFELKPKEISGIIKTRLGFHIIKMEEKLAAENGKITQVRVKHILIRGKNLNSYLEEMKKSAKVWRFLQI